MDQIKAKREEADTVCEGKVVYRPTFKNIPGLALLVCIVSAALFFSTLKIGRITPAILAFIAIGLLLCIRFRLKITTDETQIKYFGIFSTKTIQFADVVHAGWMFQHGLAKDRFFGSLVYEVLSRKERIKIDFRLFSADQMSDLVQRLEGLPDPADIADQSLRRPETERIESNSAQRTNIKAEK